MAKAKKDPRRSRGEDYDPRVTLRMRGETQTSLNAIPRNLWEGFGVLCEDKGWTKKARLAALLAADVKESGLDILAAPRAGARMSTSLSVPGDTWDDFRALCAVLGVGRTTRILALIHADTVAGGLTLGARG